MGHNDHLDDNEDDDVPIADAFDLANFDGWTDWAHHTSEAIDLLANETPRGAAVLARAYLEDALDTALLTAAIHDPTSRKHLVDLAGSRFPEKIDGWEKYARLDRRIASEMRALRELGNAFAHRPRAVKFDEPGIDKLMHKLASTLVDKNKISTPPSPEGIKTIALALRESLLFIVNGDVLREARDRVQ
jgi:hypothetical protein